MTTDFDTAINDYIHQCTRVIDERFVTIDIETDGVDPFAKDTQIVHVGLTNGTENVILSREKLDWLEINAAILRLAHPKKPILVGHNIKFDWEFLSTKLLAPKWCPYRIVDTGIVEYLLTGQAARFISLDDIATKYGHPLKPSGVKDLLKQGVKISEIADEVVLPYLEHDITTTHDIAIQQWARVSSHAMRPFVLSQMEALRAYIWLELNGMHFDRQGLVNAHFTCETQIEANEKALNQILATLHAPGDTNYTSNATLSTLVWGEPGVKYTVRELVGKYKNGKDKYKNADYLWRPNQHLDPLDFGAEAKAHGCFDVSDAMLDNVAEFLRTSGKLPLLLNYIDVLRDTRKIKKVDSTYFAPIIDMIDGSADGLVHPTIHQNATHTGRTSASKPNSQNMPPVVRKYCTTRFTDLLDGRLLDSDFSQLEVCALAQLCGDPTLIADIKDKVDIHFKTGKSVMKWKTPADMTKHERRLVKGVNFGIIYGGAAPTIAAQTGADMELVKQLIKSFYAEYPMVKLWQKDNIDRVADLGEVTDESPIIMGGYAKVAKLATETGRRYTFTESLIPEQYRRGREILNFKPTEIKNYPVQGFATGDIVPIAVGLAAHYIHQIKAGNILLLTNVVHDSMLFDCSSEQVAQVLRNFLDYMVSNGLPKVLKELFGIRLAVPFNMDHEIKTNW